MNKEFDFHFSKNDFIEDLDDNSFEKTMGDYFKMHI